MKKIFISEAIERLGSSRATVYKHINKLKIKTVKEGKKVFLSDSQYIELEKSIGNKSTHSASEKNRIKELEKELENSEKKRKKSKEKIKTLEKENIKYQTRAEVLEEQNNKIIFQMGAVAEKMQTLENEKMKLIEVAEETKKRGIFKRVFQFWKS